MADENSGLLDKVVEQVFPSVLLEGTPWIGMWRDRERNSFVNVARVFFLFAAALYISHFFLFDLPMKLEPVEKWFQFRFFMASLCILTAVFYFSKASKGPFHKIPAAITCLCICYSQARVTIWYPDAPWLYCFLFVGICSLVLRGSVVSSSVFVVIAIATQWVSLVERGIPLPTIVSAGFVTLVLVIASRSGLLAEVRYFRLTQENLDAQRRNIEMNIEFTDRIKSFIPAEIAKRLDTYLTSGGSTVLQAIDEVLRPRRRFVACLYSDIRGFTEASKDLENFVGGLVLPNVKECTTAIEEYGGIPRKIGDLVFAYFDGDSAFENLLNSLQSAFQIAEINERQMSASGKAKVSRYILISIGEAYVGNVGGFDSSVEITALGTPVNLLSRIDELTKHPGIAAKLTSGDIVLTDAAYKMMIGKGVSVVSEVLDLQSFGIEIRNFTEEKRIYRIRPTSDNKEIVGAALGQFIGLDGGGHNGERSNEAA
ncbi:MAG: hypothetical protein R3E84_07560 [Pseudomonadales bacterium]